VYAAVSAGIYPTVQEASMKMGSGFEAEYQPKAEEVQHYRELMQQYHKLADFVEYNTKLKNNRKELQNS